MNEKIPVTNNSAMPIYVAGQMIPPGETRHFDADQVPPHLRPAPPAAEDAAPEDAVLVLSAASVGAIKAAVKNLSDADLERLGELEQLKGEAARKGALEVISVEILARAANKGGEGD